MSHVEFTNESCRIYEPVISHRWISHITHMNESCRTYEWDMSHIWMSHVKHMNTACHTYKWDLSHICASQDLQHILIHIRFVQPIPFGVRFSKALSKLKAQTRTSLFTETWQKRRSSFELRKGIRECHAKWDRRYHAFGIEQFQTNQSMEYQLTK